MAVLKIWNGLWVEVPGGGDVVAAASLADNAIVRGDVGAKGVQDSGVLIDDSDNVSVPGASEIRLRAEATTRLYSNATDEVTLEAATKTTIGTPGDTEIGDGTLRILGPQTAAKVDLGTAAKPFNDAHVKTQILQDQYLCIYKDDAQTNDTTTMVDITWNQQKRVDDIYGHSTSVDAEEITINEAGDYLIVARVSLDNNDSTTRTGGEIQLVKNGTLINGAKAYTYNRHTDTGQDTAMIHIVETLAATNVIKVQFRRLSGLDALTTIAHGCSLFIQRL